MWFLKVACLNEIPLEKKINIGPYILINTPLWNISQIEWHLYNINSYKYFYYELDIFEIIYIIQMYAMKIVYIATWLIVALWKLVHWLFYCKLGSVYIYHLNHEFLHYTPMSSTRWRVVFIQTSCFKIVYIPILIIGLLLFFFKARFYRVLKSQISN